MSSEEIRQSFINFFKEQGHAVIASSPLIPADSSVLLTTAGVQQFKPYYTGELNPVKDFGARRVVSVQKCFRTTDIDEIGDETHLTFFEMLGNFCFGDYWKEEAIRFGYEFITKRLGISPERISVTVFSGNAAAPKDEESYSIWHKIIGLPKEKIKFALWDNFWGPTGNKGPCGPTTEIYVDNVEVWNIVFNEYFCEGSREDLMAGSAKLEKLKQNGIDTGMGLERLAVMLQGVKNVFETDLFHPLISKIKELAPTIHERAARVLADHLRASVFLIADGVRPANKEAGYILRRLLRRVLAYQVTNDIHGDLFAEGFTVVSQKFGKFYQEVKNRRILEVMESERDKFQQAIALGVKELKKYPTIDAKAAFYIYETFGLPVEVIKELAPEAVKGINIHDWDREFKKHQEISRAGAEKKFGGHGLILDTGELKAGSEEELKKVLRLHTATHLLQAALRQVLGKEVQQKGSDVTVERTRFDFSFPRKLTPEEIKKAEEIINDAVNNDLPVGFVEMSKDEAVKTGALFFFKEKYPERVKVYYVGHSIEDAFSKEFCGGPHVAHTAEIGKVKITKEEAVGAGVRRIRAIVE